MRKLTGERKASLACDDENVAFLKLSHRPQEWGWCLLLILLVERKRVKSIWYLAVYYAPFLLAESSEFRGPQQQLLALSA